MSIRPRVPSVKNRVSVGLTIRLLVTALLMTYAGTANGAVQPSPCTGQICMSYCPTSGSLPCSVLQPGCAYSGFSCSWWNLECFGYEDMLFDCDTNESR